ncbi:hypothetical protein JCM9957A_23450 [Kineosporia succinea]|uniref:Uncharacterized protein YlxP (DUF503 family) n=1 Tax=Kineosporia succinea TaxID=84632 RepID=A0ABT9PB13_9ACTN|nr:uncharacterized protein YlxP (DUF503 family) [Kineosporia succinea]
MCGLQTVLYDSGPKPNPSVATPSLDSRGTWAVGNLHVAPVSHDHAVIQAELATALSLDPRNVVF